MAEIKQWHRDAAKAIAKYVRDAFQKDDEQTFEMFIQCYDPYASIEPPAPQPRATEHGRWWCSRCGVAVLPVAVTNDERHDPRDGGCGDVVEWEETPTPAPTEVIEKYARSITVNSPDIGKEFDVGVEVSEVATDILTRFASEITVDAGKVDVRNTAINILGKLGSLFQECTEYDQSGFDQEPEERFDSEKWQREGIKIIAAALSAAGGGK